MENEKVESLGSLPEVRHISIDVLGHLKPKEYTPISTSSQKVWYAYDDEGFYDFLVGLRGQGYFKYFESFEVYPAGVNKLLVQMAEIDIENWTRVRGLWFQTKEARTKIFKEIGT